MQIIWTYRAPFDALITYMTVFARTDTETCRISDTQHFRTYQFSCLLMHNTFLCIMFEIRPREKKVSQESKCQTWRLVKWATWELISKNKLFNFLNLIIKMKSAVSGIRLQMSSLALEDEQICYSILKCRLLIRAEPLIAFAIILWYDKTWITNRNVCNYKVVTWHKREWALGCISASCCPLHIAQWPLARWSSQKLTQLRL